MAIAFVYTIAYNIFVKLTYEWDEKKNKANFEKHGVWFEEARTVWADSMASEYYDDSHSTNKEDRFIRIGFSTKQRLLLVVFCERSADVIRIVSARKATPKEKENYEEGI